MTAKKGALEIFYEEVARLTLNHDVIGGKACVTAKTLGEALESVNKEWWLKEASMESSAEETAEETVTISKREYNSLIEDSIILQYLESWGVDNWSGYEEAMREYREDKEKSDAEGT